MGLGCRQRRRISPRQRQRAAGSGQRRQRSKSLFLVQRPEVKPGCWRRPARSLHAARPAASTTASAPPAPYPFNCRQKEVLGSGLLH